MTFYRRKFNILLILLSLNLFLFGCSKYIISPSQIKLPEYGSKQMLTGIRDGCDSAHSSRGNSLYRTFFKFEQKPELILDDEYYDAWYRGYIYCFHIVNRRAFGSIDDNFQSEHGEWFWAKEGYNHKGIDSFLDTKGIDLDFNGGIKMPGEGQAWWNTGLFGNFGKHKCKGIFQCAAR